MKITEAYAGLVARDAYFWAWPMVNIYNRRNTFEKVPEIILAGPVPSSPLNRLGIAGFFGKLKTLENDLVNVLGAPAAEIVLPCSRPPGAG